MNPQRYATALAAQPSTVVPGLPRVTLPAGARRVVSLRSPNLAATTTSLSEPQSSAEVAGQPSMVVQMLTGGGVETLLHRNSRWTENMSAQEIEGLKTLLLKAVREAETLSRGPLSYAMLRRLRHPYGRGALTPKGQRRRGLGRQGVGSGPRAGIGNLAVINAHGGDFAGSWSGDVAASKSGVTFRLTNSSSVAAYLALGTKRMKAHGPFTTAMARVLPEINAEWLRLSRLGWAREQAMKQAAASLGGARQ